MHVCEYPLELALVSSPLEVGYIMGTISGVGERAHMAFYEVLL